MFRCIVADPPWREAGGEQKGVQEMATNEPMTDEWLDEIDEMLHDGDDLPHDLAACLADEVDRLRAREQALAAEIAAHREHIASLISQLSDCEAKRDADLEQRLALAAEIAAMRPVVEAVAAALDVTPDDLRAVAPVGTAEAGA